jgi:hypothetical protein
MWTVDPGTKNNYINAVQQALTDAEYFDRFKHDPRYNSVVGMGCEWQREKFLELVENFDEFQEMDSLCFSPTLKDGVSVTTLRYVATAQDIVRNFDYTSALELGVGFGGLCHALHLIKDTPYTFVDLPDVVELAKTYLAAFHIYPEQKKHDLFISEFCLSELDDTEINAVYETYMVDSKYLYLVMNIFDRSRKNRVIDMIKADFHVEIKPELVKSEWENWVLLGSRK